MRYTINRKTKSYTMCVSFSVSARNTQRNTFCVFKKATERYTLSVSSSISKDILLLYSIETLVKKTKHIFFWCFLGLHLAVPAVHVGFNSLRAGVLIQSFMQIVFCIVYTQRGAFHCLQDKVLSMHCWARVLSWHVRVWLDGFGFWFPWIFSPEWEKWGHSN